MPAGGSTPNKSLMRALEAFVGRVEQAEGLDGVADALAGFVDKTLPKGRVRDLASGTPLGHPLHPLLVGLPIGSWTAASYLDLMGGDAKAAQRLVGIGTTTALVAAVTGANDWLTTAGAERRVGFVHALLNDAAVMLYAASWLARRRGRRWRGAVLSLGGLAVTAGSGWLGGHLAYALGVGVDTTSFQHYPQSWTPVAEEADLVEGHMTSVDAAGVPVVILRENGRLLALADRCTHRGGPLHDGELADGCITCPWHGSQFSLEDGVVLRGPASRPAPMLEVRAAAGRIEVCRPDEPRALRLRPVGC